MIRTRWDAARAQHDQGMTLVELMVTILVFSLLGVAMTLVVTSTARNSTTARQRLIATQQAQTTMDHIGAEIRAADPLTSLSPATAFTYADTTHITLASSLGSSTGPSKVDLNVLSGKLQEQVTKADAGGPPYAWTGTPITRQLAVVGTASSSLFTYYDKSGNILATPMTTTTATSAIDHILVTLVVQESNIGGPVTISSTIYPRDTEYGSGN